MNQFFTVIDYTFYVLPFTEAFKLSDRWQFNKACLIVETIEDLFPETIHQSSCDNKTIRVSRFLKNKIIY